MTHDYHQLPLMPPDSDWVRPRELPDLRGRKIVAIDTEENDQGLSNQRGPGWPQRAGYVLGVSWAAEGSSGYAPIAHPDSDNFDKNLVADWLQGLIKSGTRLLFQNGPYDLGWMHADLGVDVPPEYPMDDLLAAAFMIDENQYEYNLDAICRRLGIEGKNEILLREAAVDYLRPPGARRSWKLKNSDLKANMWRLPARYVGPYATGDAEKTLEAFDKLRSLLQEQDVEGAYRLEMDLVPTVRRMRTRGIKIDVDYALRTRTLFRGKREEILRELNRRLPGRGGRGAIEIDHLRQNRWMETVFGDEGITPPRTEGTDKKPDGQASFKQDWMEKHPHWLPRLVSKALQYERFAEVFIGDYLLEFMHRGRVHAEAHQYKSDDGGTVSYRFAYSNPPLQQAPSPDMDPEFGVPFRRCFVADGIWGVNDYSQQEYRLTAHFAAVCKVRGGAEAAQRFVDEPDLDFHTMVADLTELTRAKAKIQNFALLFGQGLDATAAGLGLSLDEAKEVRLQVERSAPFGPALDDFCKRRAQQRGFLRLIDGARVRFDRWEAGWMPKEEWSRAKAEHWPMDACSLEEARARRANPKHPWHSTSLRRAGIRKALNRLIQGSAARQTKLAMRECARAGLTPILQMHDELDHDEDSPSKIQHVAEIMRTVVKLRVPMMVDSGTGASWAHAKMPEKKRAEWSKFMGEK